jgi:hypothetical protein
MLQADPTRGLSLIDPLIDDPSEYVRRSVANHLNDVSRDHPDLALQTAVRWRDDRLTHRVRLLRHGLRTLVKAGQPDALALVGVRADAALTVRRFACSQRVVFGSALALNAEVTNDESEPVDVVVDFVVHHVRADGTRSPKVFKWRRVRLAPRETVSLDRRHRVRAVTTRRYYPGVHQVELQVNGRRVASRDFILVMPDS